MSTSEDKKRELARQLLEEEGPSQKKLSELAELSPDQGGLLGIGARELGDHALEVIRDLGDLHEFQIRMNHITGGPTPEKIGLDPREVRLEDRGDEVMIEPARIKPLVKY